MKTKPVNMNTYKEAQYAECKNSEKIGAYIDLAKAAAADFSKWLRLIRGHSPRAILDVGCRFGYCMKVFRREFPKARVVGVDLIDEFVAEASEIAESVKCDIHELPFDVDEFDVSFCNHTLEHCYDAKLALDEIKRVTRSYIYIGIPLEGEFTFNDNSAHYLQADSLFEWENFCSDSEWQVMTSHESSVFDIASIVLGRR